MIQDMDETLRRMLTAELAQTPGCPVYDEEQVTFDPPDIADAAQDGEARVNLYLHDVRENLDRREEGISRRPGPNGQDQTIGLRRAPVHLDLSYLVTAHAGDDPAMEHRLLSDVLAVLLRFGAVPERFWTGALTGVPGGIALAIVQPEHLELLGSGGVLQAFQGQLRPGLSLVATSAFNPFETKWTKQVREFAFDVGPGEGGEGAGRAGSPTTYRLSIAGIVVDGQTEKPIEGATVSVDGYEGTLSRENGLFSLINLPPGTKTVHISRRGYRSVDVPTTVPQAGRTDQVEPLVVALRALNAKEREAEAAQAATAARNAPDIVEDDRVYKVTLTGTLLLPGGSPAAFVEVQAAGKRTMTDADGTYCFFDLPQGDHVVTATLPGQGEVIVGGPGAVDTPKKAK